MPRYKQRFNYKLLRFGWPDLIGLTLAYVVTRTLWLIYQPGPTWLFILLMFGLWSLYRLLTALIPDGR